MPNTKLYYSDILPKINDNYTEGIHFVNTSVASFCQQNRMKVINHPQFYRDYDINYKVLKHDLIHPTYSGTSTLAKNIIAYTENYNNPEDRIIFKILYSYIYIYIPISLLSTYLTRIYTCILTWRLQI